MLRSLIHFELILVQGERQESIIKSPACGYLVFPATFIKEAVFSSTCVLGSCFEDQLTVAVWVYAGSFIIIH
jgi:hypothetical protein